MLLLAPVSTKNLLPEILSLMWMSSLAKTTSSRPGQPSFPADGKIFTADGKIFTKNAVFIISVKEYLQ
jgi:hypothetical protein